MSRKEKELTQENINKIKELYIEQKRQITESLSKIHDIDIDGDDVDAIQGNTLTTILEKLSARDLVRIKQINAGLLAIEEGIINECESCSGNIGEKRLIAIPGVRICISCAEEAETTAKMFA